MPTIRYFGHEKPQKTGCILTLWAYGKKCIVSAQNKMEKWAGHEIFFVYAQNRLYNSTWKIRNREDWVLRRNFSVYAQNKAGFMAELKDGPAEQAMLIE